MAESADWLFKVGVDTTKADAAVKDFVSRTNSLLAGIRDLQLTTSAQLGSANRVLESASKRFRIEQQIGDTQNKASVSNARAEANMAAATAKRLAAEQKIAALQSGAGRSSGMTNFSATANANASAITRQKDALDTFNRILGNTVFKFIEYEVVMKTFNEGVKEFMDSLNQASNVQLEQVLQRIYDPTINVNNALKDAIVIAKKWGSDITDVQQAIGLWTKQTQQMRDETGKLVDSQTALAAAAKLAADAEKFHAASGIDSMEVYRMSVSTWHELGLTLGQIPGLYDQIAYAATKISPVLKAQPGSTSKQEGIKDIFEGLAESGAALKAQGLGPDGVIAVVASQVENLGESGKSAGKNISSMFGALDQGGKPLQEWVNILGKDAFKDQSTFFAAALANIDKIKQASADGILHVRPQQINTFREFIGTLEQVKKLAQDIHDHSKGTLDFIAQAEMDTYTGQVKRLTASFQEFNLALGTQVLPSATRFVQFLNGSLLPAMTAHVTQITGTISALGMLGAAYLTKLAVVDRFGTALKNAANNARDEAAANELAAIRVQANGEATSRALAWEQGFANAQLQTVDAIQAAKTQMEREQAALAQLQEKLQIVTWQTEQFQAQCAELGVTMEQVATIAGTTAVSGIRAFGVAVQDTIATVMRSAAPLLLLYTAMSALSNFDSVGRKNRYIDDDAHEREGGLKGWVDSAGDIVKSPLGFGDAGAFDELNRATKRKGKDSQFAKDVLADLKAYGSAKTNDQITDSAEQLKRDLFAEDQLEHPVKDRNYSNLDNIPPWLQKMMDRAKGGDSSGMTFPGAVGAKTKQATEQQIAAEAVNKAKADAMSMLSYYRDIASAANTTIATIEAVGKAHGYTADMVDKLAAAYGKEERATRNMQGTAEKEIKSLEGRQASLKKQIESHGAQIDAKGNVTKKGDGSSAVYAEAKAWRMAEEAINKARGAIEQYKAKRNELAQKAKDDIAHAQTESDMSVLFGEPLKSIGGVATLGLRSLGTSLAIPAIPKETLGSIEGLNEHLKDVKASAGTAVGAYNQWQAALLASNGLRDIEAKLVAYVRAQEAAGHAIDPALIATIKAYDRAIGDFGKTAEAQAGKVQELTDSITGLLSNAIGKNLDDIGSLLGLDKGTVQEQKTLIDGYKSINDELKQMDTWVKDYGGTYANLPPQAKAMVDQMGQQVQLQQQLVPLLAEEERIRNSIAYKATENVLQSAGDQGISDVVDKMMGKAKTGLHALVGDWLKQVVQGWWAQTAQRLTDALFQSPAEKARQLLTKVYAANAKALQDIAIFNRDHVVNEFGKFTNLLNNGQFVQVMRKATDAIQQAGVTGDKPGFKDGQYQGMSQGDLFQKMIDAQTGNDPQATQNQANATAQGVDASATQNRTADGVEQIHQDMQDLGSLISGAQSGTFSGAGGGMSLLSNLIGFLPAKAQAGVQKYLQGNGAWLSNGLDGIAQGQMWGQEMGGGTHSIWGSVGGGVGGTLGTIFGGPVGGQIGASIGSFVGSLFGHADDPSKMPDKYDTQRYMTYVGELTGSAGANGQHFNASTDQTIQSLGGKSMLQYIQDWIKTNLNSSNKDTKALAQQLAGQYGTTGNGQLSFGKDIGQESVVGGSLSGTYVSIHDAASQAVDSIKKLGDAANKAQAPIIAISAYGAPSGYQVNPYNTPGLTSQEWKGLVDNGLSGFPMTSNPQTPGMGSGGYSTPGYGRHPLPLPVAPIKRPPVMSAPLPINVTTNVVLDGHVLATSVNAVNVQNAYRRGELAA